MHTNIGLNSASENYHTLASNLSLYVSPSLAPQWTIALRGGGAHTFGDFPFYAANTLGSSENLRGFRSTRFSGRSSFYTNAELRGKLFHFARYLGFGDVGILGFLDNGRVWTDGESSTVWHSGYGGGLWFEAFDSTVLTGTMGFSEEENMFALSFGFLF